MLHNVRGSLRGQPDRPRLIHHTPLRPATSSSQTCPTAAFITDPGVVRKILDHLGLPSADPPRGPSRFERREEQVEMFEGWEEEGEARAGRDPPGED
jgi:hypothetical protein